MRLQKYIYIFVFIRPLNFLYFLKIVLYFLQLFYYFIFKRIWVL
jgi:hypothetical protein